MGERGGAEIQLYLASLLLLNDLFSISNDHLISSVIIFQSPTQSSALLSVFMALSSLALQGVSKLLLQSKLARIIVISIITSIQ